MLCGSEASSKKRALELLSELLGTTLDEHDPEAVFDGLLDRERLGTTALGHGVAIPHTRLKQLDKPTLAMMKLERGVDFDAPDQKPVDLLFALAVPEESNEQHLLILATLAEMLSDQSLVTELRNSHSCEAIHEKLQQWHPHIAA